MPINFIWWHNLDQWVKQKDKTQPAPWKIVDNNQYGSSSWFWGYKPQKWKFGDCQIHIELVLRIEVEGSKPG